MMDTNEMINNEIEIFLRFAYSNIYKSAGRYAGRFYVQADLSYRRHENIPVDLALLSITFCRCGSFN
jgi:hypothetical protein